MDLDLDNIMEMDSGPSPVAINNANVITNATPSPLPPPPAATTTTPKPVAVFEFKPNAASPIVTYNVQPAVAQVQQPQVQGASLTPSSGLSGSASSAPVPFSVNANAGFEPALSAGFALSDMVTQLEDYPPTIPDSVTNHFLHMAGFETSDPRLSRLISIAAQKYISDILNDAFTHCKLRGSAQTTGGNAKNKVKDKKYVLTMEDLVPVLNDQGVTVRKPPYFV